MAVDLDDAVACLDACSVGGAVSVDTTNTSRQLAGEGKSETQGTLEDGYLWERFIIKIISSTIKDNRFSLNYISCFSFI